MRDSRKARVATDEQQRGDVREVPQTYGEPVGRVKDFIVFSEMRSQQSFE